MMRLMGLVSASPRPSISTPYRLHEVYPHHFRGLDINRPNQVFCTDKPFIQIPIGFV